MGRKGWFSSVKKALSPVSKGKKAEKENEKRKWVEQERPSVSYSPNPEPVGVCHPHPMEELKLTEVEDQQTRHAHSVSIAKAAPSKAAVAASEASDPVARPTKATQFAGKSREEVAVIKIQTAFRGYLARRALRALKGLVRLKLLVDGATVKRQISNTLKSMQTLSSVQSQVQSRKIITSEENRALQRQLVQKCAKELESLKVGEEWDDSLQSKEQIEANLLQKFEAAMRRERSLAYSYTHQQTWKKSAKSTNLLFMDPTNPHWGWSSLERWVAAASWEAHNTAEKDVNSDRLCVKSTSLGIAGEITRSFARRHLNSDDPSSRDGEKPRSHHSPATPSKAIPSSAARRSKPASPIGSVAGQNDDSRDILGILSEHNRRHSIAGSSVRDDESLVSSPSVPSYKTPTRSAKAKLKLASPLGMESGGAPGKGSAAPAKKRLSFPPSPARPGRS